MNLCNFSLTVIGYYYTGVLIVCSEIWGSRWVFYNLPIKFQCVRGAPEWLSRLSIQLWLRSWSHSSWVQDPHWAGLCADSSEPGACFGFCISLSFCPSLARDLCLKNEWTLNKFFYVKKSQCFCVPCLRAVIITHVSSYIALGDTGRPEEAGIGGASSLALYWIPVRSFPLETRPLFLDTFDKDFSSPPPCQGHRKFSHIFTMRI